MKVMSMADSLGGVSMPIIYTPQVVFNTRHGARLIWKRLFEMRVGCTDFLAIITYTRYKNPNSQPLSVSQLYLKGNVIHDEFDNVNPDVVNQALNKATPTTKPTTQTTISLGLILIKMEK
jgi:hypothetical protein